MDLQLPVDFERLPEFRVLCLALAERANGKELPVAAVAVFVWTRLWVELAYLAQTTSTPGLLTKEVVTLYERSLDPLFGEDCPATKILVEAGCLKAKGEDFHCERFARLNGHLAGNYKSKELRGAAGSTVERNKQRIAQEAVHQTLLLGTEEFTKRDGTPLEGRDLQRAMVVIKTIDNCLKVSGRRKAEYTEGLILDAAEAAGRYTEEQLKGFYKWLILNREASGLPKTTEQVLAQVGVYVTESARE